MERRGLMRGTEMTQYFSLLISRVWKDSGLWTMKKGGYFMLTESAKQDLREMTDLLKGLDSIGMLIIKSNATVLLARQELAESRELQKRATEFSHYNRQQ